MKKDAYYFPHDSNATEDPKMMLLIDELGMEGYGIFWMLLESLRNQKDYKYPVKFLKSLCRMKNADKETVLKVINDYELFVMEEDFFFSDSFLKRMKAIDERRARLSENGRKGGKKTQSQKRNSSKASSKASTPVQQEFKQNSSDAKAIKEKEIKEKEIKEDNSLTFFFRNFDNSLSLIDKEYFSHNYQEVIFTIKRIHSLDEKQINDYIESFFLNKASFEFENENHVKSSFRKFVEIEQNKTQEETTSKRVWKTQAEIDKENGFNQPIRKQYGQ